MKEKIQAFYLEHKQKILIGSIVFVAVFLTWISISNQNSEEEQLYKSSQQEIEMKLNEVQNTFSLLQEYNVGYIEGSLAYEYDLFLKRPFISQEDFESAVQYFIDLLKYKYNDDKKKQYIVGVKLNVYDRKSNYDDNTNPRATVVYQLTEEDKKKRNKEDEYSANADLRWEHTISQTKKPDYRKYSLISNFLSLDISEVQPFSEKEFSLFKKLLIYEELTGSFNAGLNAYFVWELGIPQFESKYLIQKQFEDFVKIAETYGENMSIYSGKQLELFERFAIENPRFLAYILTNEIFDDRLEAKKALVQYDREFFLDIYIQEAQQKVKELGGEEGIKALKEVETLKNTPIENDQVNNQSKVNNNLNSNDSTNTSSNDNQTKIYYEDLPYEIPRTNNKLLDDNSEKYVLEEDLEVDFDEPSYQGEDFSNTRGDD